MTGYDASVLNNPETKLLLVVPNWLGDGIMVMPALQVLRTQLHPESKIWVAARPGQVGLWEMQAAIHEVISLPASNRELLSSAGIIKKEAFTHAVILPHSFRSALLCRLAGIPHRRGTVDQAGRRLLINDPVSLSDQRARHQQWEIAKLLLPGPLPDQLPAPELKPPASAIHEAKTLLSRLPRPILACIPGAARGPSKQWPGERFQAVASAWIQQTGGGVCWLGTPADTALCETLNRNLGINGLNLAGKTNLKTFTALLQEVNQALVNDSGGMHVAAAVGTPLVAIFGQTDPDKTGPLSPLAHVLQHSETKNRAIARESRDAEASLAKVGVEEVVEAVLAKCVPTS